MTFTPGCKHTDDLLSPERLPAWVLPRLHARFPNIDNKFTSFNLLGRIVSRKYKLTGAFTESCTSNITVMESALWNKNTIFRKNYEFLHKCKELKKEKHINIKNCIVFLTEENRKCDCSSEIQWCSHTSLLSGLLSCMLADMGPVELSSSKSLAISPCIVNVSCVSSKSKARRVSNTDPEIIRY